MSMKAIGSVKISLTDMHRLETICYRIKKSPASEDTLTNPLVNVTRTVQIWRTLPLTVIDHCEGNCIGENLSY